MGGAKQKVQSVFMVFDVYYEDGTRTSNRKVPASELGGLDGDAWGRAFVENSGRHDRRDVWHATWTHDDDSTVTKIIKLTECARSHCAP
jgi:hypothetical protein